MKPLAVYVHIPFCTVKCGYCDFNAYAGLHPLREAYTRALLAEVHGHAALLGSREVTSVAFGGGTPNELDATAIVSVLEAIRTRAGSFPPAAEVSLEANPGTTSLAQLCDLRRGGVTRVSFGAQSFDPAELRFLDRIHSPEATRASLRLARAAGFASVNLDLIYGLPGQSLEAWEACLEQAIELQPDHLSCYALTVEAGTPLAARVARGDVTPADADLVADMYERASEVLAATEFAQYELSNWAQPGHESRHNLSYWTDRDYLGIGAGAHGYVAGWRTENHAHPRTYIQAAEAGASCVAHSYLPGRATAIADWLTMRLRLVAGFEAQEFRERFGVDLTALAGTTIRDCVDAGVLRLQPRVALTGRGRQLHSEVAVRLMAELSGR